jgi:hypothetical protein
MEKCFYLIANKINLVDGQIIVERQPQQRVSPSIGVWQVLTVILRSIKIRFMQGQIMKNSTDIIFLQMSD